MTYTELYIKAIIKWLKADYIWLGMIFVAICYALLTFAYGYKLTIAYPEYFLKPYESNETHEVTYI